MENEIVINGITYARKTENLKNEKGLILCIVRTYSAGVFLAYVDYESSKDAFLDVRLVDAIRIWRWDGAFTLSELAINGTKKPENCKWSVSVPEMKVNRVIEKIPVTKEAIDTFKEIKPYE